MKLILEVFKFKDFFCKLELFDFFSFQLVEIFETTLS